MSLLTVLLPVCFHPCRLGTSIVVWVQTRSAVEVQLEMGLLYLHFGTFSHMMSWVFPFCQTDSDSRVVVAL